ncbi:uncharacterized protein [Centruroides vittatus]|uniref:uncharacterized protein n=1 Tax=Centruroides vittatus TaxID=120091 RepID=UPI00350ED3A1
MEGNGFVTQDPNELTRTLQNLNLMNDEIGTVMDFESLYPSINLTSCFKELIEFLIQQNQEVEKFMENLQNLADLICFHSFFKFNGVIYKQKNGVAMGSPTSGFLCELVIRKLEKNIIEDFADGIVIYKRYVDDVLIIWKDDQRINDFLTAINDNEHGLKLKLEQKSQRNIHFLDINMEFKLRNIQTTVYWKPTHAPLYIPACLKDPFKYKLSAFKALIKRAFLYCTDVLDRDKEINRIQKVAKNLGYKMSTIKSLIKSYSKQKGTTATNNGTTTFNKFTYNEQTRKVVKELGKYKNTNIIYK